MKNFFQRLLNRKKAVTVACSFRFETIQEAASFIGKNVTHNPVEAPSRTGTLLSVEANGYLTVGDWTYRCLYWQCHPENN